MPRINLYGAILRALAPGAHHELARQIEFLKEENRILRSRLPGRVIVTPVERSRLVRLGRSLGRAVDGLISIVSPRTFARWLGAAAQPRRASTKAGRPPGRPPIRIPLADLIRQMARETDWGYTRIHNQLRRLHCSDVSRSTVANIVRAERGPGGSPDGGGSWDLFIRSHAESLWACDFISRKVLTPRGLIEHFVLFFIHVASRRVVVSPATARPNAAWMVEQARSFAAAVAAQTPSSESGAVPRVHTVLQAAPDGHGGADLHRERGPQARALRVLRDNDRKFSREFDEALRAAGIEPHPLPIQSPNLNAYAERWVQTAKRECLDHFVVFGAAHLDFLIGAFVDYYHRHRPHQGLGGRTIVEAALGPDEAPPSADGRILRCESLGGRLTWYRRDRQAV